MKTLSNTAARLRDRVDELAEQWTNGNRGDVIKEIIGSDPTLAAYTTAALGQKLLSSDVRVLMSTLLEAAVDKIGPTDLR